MENKIVVDCCIYEVNPFTANTHVVPCVGLFKVYDLNNSLKNEQSPQGCVLMVPRRLTFGIRRQGKIFWSPEQAPLCKVRGAIKKAKAYNMLILVHCPSEAWREQFHSR